MKSEGCWAAFRVPHGLLSTMETWKEARYNKHWKKAAFKQIEETVKQNRSRKNWAFWWCSREVLGEQRGRRREKIARQLVWNRKEKQKWRGDEERVYRSLVCSINSDDTDISMLRRWWQWRYSMFQRTGASWNLKQISWLQLRCKCLSADRLLQQKMITLTFVVKVCVLCFITLHTNYVTFKMMRHQGSFWVLA